MGKRYIDADKLKAHYAWWKGGTREMTMDEAKSDFDTIVDLQPTVEVEPIEIRATYEQKAYNKGYADGIAENRQARWKGAGMGDYMCSLCNMVVSGNHYHYCPNCGAKMDEVEE